MDKEIIVYSSEGCSMCMLLKKMFDSAGISYQNVTDNVEVYKKADEVSAMGFPILEIDKETYSGQKAVMMGKSLIETQEK